LISPLPIRNIALYAGAELNESTEAAAAAAGSSDDSGRSTGASGNSTGQLYGSSSVPKGPAD
jgi:hypothetical protein